MAAVREPGDTNSIYGHLSPGAYDFRITGIDLGVKEIFSVAVGSDSPQEVVLRLDAADFGR